jgi:hypothetical protein
MTREDIIRMAQECCLIGMRPHLDGLYQESIERFAALVAAAERDAIYQIASENCNDEPEDAIITSYMSGQYVMAEYLCERIKARGQE